MSINPSILARVPNLLSSHVFYGSISRASVDLMDLQMKLASGKQINRPSDDAIGTSTVSVLDDIIERDRIRVDQDAFQGGRIPVDESGIDRVAPLPGDRFSICVYQWCHGDPAGC